MTTLFRGMLVRSVYPGRLPPKHGQRFRVILNQLLDRGKIGVDSFGRLRR